MERTARGPYCARADVGLLISLRAKGEAVEELVGFAGPCGGTCPAIPRGARRIACVPLVDTCGTGGDGGGTFNVSTTAALVVAGAGVRVAKHGNRSFSSRCGSADVLEALGVNIDIEPQRALEAIDTMGIAFLFAPTMHTAMRHAIAARREVGGRTVFNLLGPLTNPAGATAQVIGVPAPVLVEKLGHALAELGGMRVRGAWHGRNGRNFAERGNRSGGRAAAFGAALSRETGGFRGCAGDREEMAGGDAAMNAQIIRGVLEGERGPSGTSCASMRRRRWWPRTAPRIFEKGCN